MAEAQASSLLEFGEPGNMRRWLVGLVLDGHKRATAGLMSDYEAENEEIDEVGNHQVVVDDDGQPVAEVIITDVRAVRLADVPWEFVAAENEGDSTIEEWRAGHEAYWRSVGVRVDDDSLLVLVWFEVTQVLRDWPIPRVVREAVEVLRN